ncbi:hypothetical protein AB0940_33320 [Streptomyces sp. NPDC006656]|uniref:hypothetical protein n=1 Tax=Streptomyces sp. NPDC006656 TaxID=3156899 RepID=UPI003456BC4E
MEKRGRAGFREPDAEFAEPLAKAQALFRLDDPWLTLANDPASENQLSGWAAEDDGDALAELAAGACGAAVRRLTVPGTTALAVPHNYG